MLRYTGRKSPLELRMAKKLTAAERPLEKVEVFVHLINGDFSPYEGEFAAELLLKYQRLIAHGGLEGWEIIHGMLGDDWGAPPKYVQILVDGEEIARIPYDKPKRSRR